MTTRTIGFLIALCVAVCFLSGCAAGPNTLKGTSNDDGNVAGFWRGLWHGWILPFTFIISLFVGNLNVYEVHNNGGWYNFGFLLGVMFFFGGGGRAAKTR